MLGALTIFVALPFAPVAVLLTIEGLRHWREARFEARVRAACCHPANRKD